MSPWVDFKCCRFNFDTLALGRKLMHKSTLLFFRVESVSFSDWYILSFLLRFYYCSQSSIYYNRFQFMLTTFQILSYMKDAGGVRHLSGVDSLGFQRCHSSSQACPAGTVTHWPICQLGFSTQNLGEQSCLLARPHEMEKASHHPAGGTECLSISGDVRLLGC